jgi:cell wall assembly regulator SMI1
MAHNSFTNLAQPISGDDLNALEKAIGASLPDSFKAHYLKYNGGVPENTYWLEPDTGVDFEIAEFKSISASGDDNAPSILSTYNSMIRKNVLPSRLLPFANDWGGNFFCLDLGTAAVKFFATDCFDPERSMEVNHKHAERHLCSDFEQFVKHLISEEDLEDQ